MPHLPAPGTEEDTILNHIREGITEIMARVEEVAPDEAIAAFNAADVRLLLAREIVAAHRKALERAININAPNRKEIEEGLEHALKELEKAYEAYEETRKEAAVALQ